MLRKVLVSTLALSLAAGSAALAQDNGPAQAPAAPERAERGPARMFDRLDADGNGTIAADEFGGARLEMLQAADADGNGTLTQEEIASYLMQREFQRKAERASRMLDIDGDGTVTLAEIEEHQGKRFALMDRDSDGELSQDEMRRSASEWRGMRGRDGHGPRFAMRGERGERHKFMRGGMHHMERAAPAAPADETPAAE